MKKIISLSLAAVVGLTANFSAPAATTLDDLLREVRNQERLQQQVNQQREAEFRANKATQERKLRDARNKLASAEATANNLQAQFQANELKLTELETELRAKQGNLGELFGVVRQAANSIQGDLKASLISAQYPGRDMLLENLNDSGTPSMQELRDFYVLLLQEMTEQGKVTTFTADVVNTAGLTESQTVKRIGAFNLTSGDDYLFFEDGKINTLQVQPNAQVLNALSAYNGVSSGYGGMYLDPSKGGILQLEKLKMSLPERLWKYKGVAGWAVLVLLIVGVIIALERLFMLYVVTGPAINSQKKNSTPKNNPLGRIMKVYLANKNEDTENLELKLDEAVLKETPKIERGINLIKVIAALGPLLGLLGTVTGMIEVFQSITLHGTGDPRTMADGISKALATTVWGLLAAIPLTFLHAIVAGKSKNIIHTLEEQSTGLMASHEENA
ncbi:MotA/TolQ/ExbB proton channel family protein [Kangiella sp. TOML190]|uniref:MotA/TolQ/ExbB proton channel family protein n=1 Tax=Kangiella sp. TOML190 TaxID=2931351 RepID=UPI0020418C66|nr:MotA/TolQ/ExbB proton channel family protein [Kangiella sp. TOML190]